MRAYSANVVNDWLHHRQTPSDGWSILKLSIMDVTGASDVDIDRLVDELREKVEWLLDPGWAQSLAAPGLIKNRIKSVFASVPNLDPQLVFRWMSVLLD